MAYGRKIDYDTKTGSFIEASVHVYNSIIIIVSTRSCCSIRGLAVFETAKSLQP